MDLVESVAFASFPKAAALRGRLPGRRRKMVGNSVESAVPTSDVEGGLRRALVRCGVTATGVSTRTDGTAVWLAGGRARGFSPTSLAGRAFDQLIRLAVPQLNARVLG